MPRRLAAALNEPVAAELSSEDVIHSFFVPEWRLKQDAVPGMHIIAWFQATKTGEYHLFCAEYCGTKHSGMIGWIQVMDPVEFQAWLAGLDAPPGVLGTVVGLRGEPVAGGPLRRADGERFDERGHERAAARAPGALPRSMYKQPLVAVRPAVQGPAPRRGSSHLPGRS